MFSKEKSKQLKKKFWTSFGQFSQLKRVAIGFNKKWLSHRTGIHCLSLKFEFDRKFASVGIEIDTEKDTEKEKYYNRLISLKTVLNNCFTSPPVWDTKYELVNGKIVIKIHHILNNVHIHDESCWPDVFQFFFDHMIKYEGFYMEFQDIIKDPEI